MELHFGGIIARKTPFQEFHDLVAGDFLRVFDRPLMAAGYPLRLLLLEGRTRVGWHLGRMIDLETYEMTNSCVLPEFRRRGIYSAFTESLTADLRARGVRKVVSRHRPGNVPVLAAKSRLGFRPAGQVEDHRFGRLLCLEFRL
jgi:ribosomal protein S18 acetylase RimI-like enzyme